MWAFLEFKIFAGMDAQVAYGFHHLRNEKPYLAQGPIANKVLIVKCMSCSMHFLYTKFLILLRDENRETCYRINMHALHILGSVLKLALLFFGLFENNTVAWVGVPSFFALH